MIKSYINQSEFVDALTRTYDNSNFSYEGKVALFEYLEQLSDDIGEDIELDPIAICCEYSEYSDLDEAAREYFEYEGMTYGDDSEELESVEEVEEKARKFLNDRTQVIEFEGGVIIQKF